MYRASFLLVLLIAVIPEAFAQFKVPDKPEVQTSVYDYAKILKEAEKLSLEDKLVRYSDTTSTQIVVITVDSLAGESIGDLTPRWAHEWGIGQADKDNGVLILLAEAERKIWIAPGYGVDDRLTAGILGQMIRNEIIPEFKAGSYYGGLDKGADSIFLLLQGKYKETRDDGYNFLDYVCVVLTYFIIFGFLLALLIFRIKSKSTYTYSNSSSTYSSSGKSSSSASTSRSGFRGGFGGGGFSGGGAGGSW